MAPILPEGATEIDESTGFIVAKGTASNCQSRSEVKQYRPGGA
jgi:hypothetical protein